MAGGEPPPAGAARRGREHPRPLPRRARASRNDRRAGFWSRPESNRSSRCSASAPFGQGRSRPAPRSIGCEAGGDRPRSSIRSVEGRELSMTETKLADRARTARSALSSASPSATPSARRSSSSRENSYPPITSMIGGGPFRLKPGEWTDDTSMALCLAKASSRIRGRSFRTTSPSASSAGGGRARTA